MHKFVKGAPCPQCGAGTMVGVSHDIKLGVRYVECDACHVQGPSTKTWEAAWKAWNRWAKQFSALNKLAGSVPDPGQPRRDVVMSELERKYSAAGGSIELNSKEAHNLNAFCRRHAACSRFNRVRVSTKSNAISLTVSVECLGCGIVNDISDLNSW